MKLTRQIAIAASAEQTQKTLTDLETALNGVVNKFFEDRPVTIETLTIALTAPCAVVAQIIVTNSQTDMECGDGVHAAKRTIERIVRREFKRRGEFQCR